MLKKRELPHLGGPWIAMSVPILDGFVRAMLHAALRFERPFDPVGYRRKSVSRVMSTPLSLASFRMGSCQRQWINPRARQLQTACGSQPSSLASFVGPPKSLIMVPRSLMAANLTRIVWICKPQFTR